MLPLKNKDHDPIIFEVDPSAKRARGEPQQNLKVNLPEILKNIFSPTETGNLLTCHQVLKCSESPSSIPPFDPKRHSSQSYSYIATAVYMQSVAKFISIRNLESSESDQESDVDSQSSESEESSSQAKTENYVEFVQQDMKDLELAYTEVVLPLLFSRNYIIRPAHPTDRDNLSEFLSNLSTIFDTVFTKDKDQFQFRYAQVANRFGKIRTRDDSEVKGMHRIFLIQSLAEIQFKKATGIIQIELRNKTCIVHAISIDEKEKGTGLATALMGLAYKIALIYKCSELSLSIANDSGPFYVRFGLRPSTAPALEWESFEY